MMSLRFPAIAALVYLSIAVSPASAAREKIGPSQMVSDAQTAVADAARLFRERKLSMNEAVFHPLLLSLREVNRALGRVDKLRTARSAAFFVSLSDVRAAVSAVTLSFRKTGVRNAELEGALERLAVSVHHLHRSYSWEELRRRRKGSLSDTERSELRTMNERRSSAISKIGVLRDKLRTVDGGEKIARGLDELIALAREVQVERPNLDAWFGFRMSLDPLFGRWEALSYYTDRGLKLDWTFIDSDIRTLRALYQSSLRATAVDNWSYFDRQIAVPEGYVSPPSVVAEGERAELLSFLANLEFQKEGDAAFALYESWDREGAVEAVQEEPLEEEGDYSDTSEEPYRSDQEIPSGEGLESAGDGSSDLVPDDTEDSALVPPIPLEEPAADAEW